jgi:hypothetical protein
MHIQDAGEVLTYVSSCYVHMYNHVIYICIIMLCTYLSRPCMYYQVIYICITITYVSSCYIHMYNHIIYNIYHHAIHICILLWYPSFPECLHVLCTNTHTNPPSLAHMLQYFTYLSCYIASAYIYYIIYIHIYIYIMLCLPLI